MKKTTIAMKDKIIATIEIIIEKITTEKTLIQENKIEIISLN